MKAKNIELQDNTNLLSLAYKISTRIFYNLNFKFTLDSEYRCVSEKMHELIQDELSCFFGELVLTNAQKDIIDQVGPDKLATNMAGKLWFDRGGFTIVFGNGIHKTELTRTYFNALKSRLGWGYSPYSADDVWTYDVLNDDREARKKEVLVSFNNHLFMFSSKLQSDRLYRDLMEENNTFMKTLRQAPDYSLSGWLGWNANITLFNSYASPLFALACFSKLISVLLSGQKEMQDGNCQIVGESIRFFSGEKTVRKIAKCLPCVNKMLAETKDEELSMRMAQLG